MSTSARQLARVISRPVKKLQKPRPLKSSNVTRHSTVDTTNLNIFDEMMLMVEAIAGNLSSGNFDRNLQSNIVSVSGLLKNYGQNLEVIYKDQLDRAFVIFRNGCRDESLDYTSRLHLLELIELRAMNWTLTDGNTYYKHKYNHPDLDLFSMSSLEQHNSNNSSTFQNTQLLNSVTTAVSQPLLLGPGELVKSSGKYASPTLIPGKNYCKDEVVIRNSDSGKVMGIKGRRVHMIEELSETVISFQRVNPGAKERLVQIIGPTEEKIDYAKQLMEETIKRNASPVRSEMLDKEKHGSNSSLNSSASEDSSRYGNLNDSSKRSTLLHSFSTSDATIGEYKYTVTIGEDTLKITGTNPNLVTIAKLVLDEYFLSETNDQCGQGFFEDSTNYFGRIYVPENDDDVFNAGHPLIQSPSIKNVESVNLSTSPTKIGENGNFQAKESSPSLQDANLESINELINRKLAATQDDSTSASVKKDGTSSLITYTIEKLVFYADSPLSRQIPKISKSLATMVKKKPPIDWFDSKTYMKERLQTSEEIASASVVSVQEEKTPDPE